MGNTGALLLHGLFEHKGRHKINADWFNNLNIDTTLIDLPGHGKKDPNRGDIDSWERNDQVVEEAFKSLNNFDNKILIGHSYGGLIATYSTLKGIISPDYLILSAPLFKDNYPKAIRSLSKPMASIAPKLRAPSPVNKRNLSTDTDVVDDYFSDPLVFRSLSFRFGFLITEAQKYVNKNINKLDIPTIVLHGKEDKIVPISGCSEIAKLENVTFVEVKNSKHEILNQETRPLVLSEIFNWLRKNELV
ncbi:lysophospholipase [Candidatus Actinomarina]|nr:lysophospholipase [Candidatus Actinomarina sp.]